MAKRLRSVYSDKMIRIMLQDEAGFGRISKSKYCWSRKHVRPSVPSHHVREYRYAYGSVGPLSKEKFFLVLSQSDTVNMNVGV